MDRYNLTGYSTHNYIGYSSDYYAVPEYADRPEGIAPMLDRRSDHAYGLVVSNTLTDYQYHGIWLTYRLLKMKV